MELSTCWPGGTCINPPSWRPSTSLNNQTIFSRFSILSIHENMPFWSATRLSITSNWVHNFPKTTWYFFFFFFFWRRRNEMKVKIVQSKQITKMYAICGIWKQWARGIFREKKKEVLPFPSYSKHARQDITMSSNKFCSWVHNNV